MLAYLAPLLVLLVPLMAAGCSEARQEAEAAEWEEIGSMRGPRGELAVVRWRDSAIVVGGMGGPMLGSDAVEVYDLRTGQWSDLPNLPEPRHRLALAVVDDVLYAIGGAKGVNPKRAVETVYALDLKAGRAARWQTRAALPAPRSALRAEVIGGKIYVVGGIGPGNAAKAWVYDPQADRWSAIADLPTTREHLMTAALGGRLYAIGGRQGARNVAVVEVYDPAADRWQRAADMPTPRSGGTAVVAGDRVHVLGGEDPSTWGGRVYRSHEIYDPASDGWTAAPPLPRPLHGVQGVYDRGRIVLFGGADRHGIWSVLGWRDAVLSREVR